MARAALLMDVIRRVFKMRGPENDARRFDAGVVSIEQSRGVTSTAAD